MIKAPIPPDDLLRLQDLYELGILDTPEEDELTEIVQLASRICGTPISLISLVDHTRQWFKAKVGVDAKETPRDISFCGHAIVMDKPFFEVADALKDTRFFDNPLVISSPNIRFYAGVQLVSKKGFKIGMLCVNDIKPNKLTEEQVFALKVLGNHVAKLLDLRITRKQSDEKSKFIESQNAVLRKMISIIAHDVRGPVASLKNIIELSDSKDIDEATRQTLSGMAVVQIDSTLNLLNNLVDWASIQTGITIKQIELSKVKEVVDGELALLMQTATQKGNTLVNLVTEKLELKIDPNMLKFIIRNLITNSNKFTSDGKILVYADTDDQYNRIIINDTGIGMSQNAIENLLNQTKIFTTTGTNNEKGSGLGFRLIKEFMENIGGKIDINSLIGKGTSIYLYFPIH